ncbi:ExeM/NucH family extracellular endonuclease [Mangrovitalea sediminis]|uniref:ExeM/NucH family extracellular endonuclease n=1 Tax=Mangrovitalea sediminis TaxID=1982043 RepID=UPI000BE4D886|nr:ExeM/NucH family extracellular endonuclease [Mangrovitalea sediminis]
MALSLPASSLACSASQSIPAIQGTYDRSPLVGQEVRVIGTVTGDFSARDRLGGFFIETPPGSAPEENRSRGLFVYAPGHQVQVGEKVEVSGRVREYHGLTEISPLYRLKTCPSPAQISPVPLDLATLTPAWLEAHEGMLVQLSGQPTVVDLSDYQRYGSLLLAPGRQFAPTQSLASGTAAYQHGEAQRRQQFLLDDGSQQTFAGQAPAIVEDKGQLRVGDRVLSATGILDYRFGHWRLQPVTAPHFSRDNPRPAPPGKAPGTRLRLVSFNLENFFNGDGQGGGFPTARGADTEQAYQRQLANLRTAIRSLSPDILGAMELENDGFGEHSAIADLARALGPQWAYVKPSGLRSLGTDMITVGLLYRRDRVTPVGQARTLLSGPFSELSRPPLWQRFRVAGDGTSFAVVVNHLKSRLCRHAEGANRDRHDGQGCWSASRAQAARYEVHWLKTLPTAKGGTLILGDLNSYARESSIQAFVSAGYADQVNRFIGPKAYSYVYDGRSGYLDYALANSRMARQVGAVAEWHIDADEDPVLVHHRPASVQPWRASDHDPLIVDLKRRASPID